MLNDKINFAALIEPVAIKFWGQPRERSSGELRWGSRGSRSVDLAKGTWFDHENNVGGGVLALIIREAHCTDNKAAIRWLRDNGHIEGGARRIDKVYWYVDEQRKKLFQVVRFVPKDFRQRRKVNGEWVWNLGDVRRVLFRLPELIKAVKDGKWIYIPEGEKDVIKLRKLGFAATTNPGGASSGKTKWRDEYSIYLEGADVILLPDNDDEPGRKHVAAVAAKLHGIAKTIRIVDLAKHWPEGADAPEEGADVSDWFEAGGTAEQLEQIADGTAEWEPSEDEASQTSLLVVPAPNEPMLCAEKFLEDKYLTADGVRSLRFYNGAFYSWSGTHYTEMDILEVRSALYQYFGTKVYLGSGKPQAFKPNQNRVSGIIDALKGVAIESRTSKPPFYMDGDGGSAEGLIAFRNGLLDIATRKLQPHTAKLFNVNSLPYDYDPEAPAYPKKWMEFLRQLWPGNGDGKVARQCLQEIFGLLLTPDTKFHKIFMLVGRTRSGKGTIGRVLTAMLGQDNVAGPTLDSMNGEFGLSQLINKVLATVADARLGRDTTKVVERLLQISGGDMININRKYESYWTGYLNVRFLLLSNELPRFADASATIAGRFVVLMMEESFYGRENLTLTEELKTELSSILNWSLIGLERLHKRGHFAMPQTSTEAIRQLEDLASPVKAFVRAWCKVGMDEEVNTKTLYNAYRAWCEREGHRVDNNSVFGRNLKSVVAKLSDKDDGPRRRYVGIALSAYGQKQYDASCQP